MRGLLLLFLMMGSTFSWSAEKLNSKKTFSAPALALEFKTSDSVAIPNVAVTIEYQQQRYKFLSWDYSGSFDCVGKPRLGVWGEENLLIERLLSDSNGTAQIAAYEKQLKFPVRPIPRFDSSSDVTISIGHGMGRVDDPAGILLIKEPYTDGNGRKQICSVFLSDSESIIRLQEKLQSYKKLAQLPSRISIRLALDSKKLAKMLEENIKRCQQTLAH